LSPNEVERESELNRQAEAGTQLSMQDNAVDDKYDEEKYQAMQKEVENQRVMASERQRFQEDHYAQVTQSMNRLQEESDKLAKETIDPQRYWNSKSTGDKILSVFASALGGMAGGKDQNNNMALKILQTNITRDIEAQAFNIQNRRTGVKERAGLLAQRWEQFKDMDLAKKAAAVDAYQVMRQQLDSLTAGAHSEHVKNNYGKLAEQLNATQENLRFDFQQTADQRAQAYAAEQARLRAAAYAGAAKKREDMMKDLRAFNEKLALNRDSEGNLDPKDPLTLEQYAPIYAGIGDLTGALSSKGGSNKKGIAITDADGKTQIVQPNSKEAAAKIEKLAELRSKFMVIMEQRNKLLTQHGTKYTGEGGDLLKANHAQLQMAIKEHLYNLGGALSEGEAEKITNTVRDPSELSSGFKGVERIQAQDKQLMDSINKQVDAELRSLVKPGTTNPTAADIGIIPGPAPITTTTTTGRLPAREADPIGIEQYAVTLREHSKGALTPQEARGQAELIMSGKISPPETESAAMVQIRELRGARKEKSLVDASPTEAREIYGQ
jgi:hypothetical protein